MASKQRGKVSAQAVLGDPVCLLAFGLGLGLAPIAPGTFGTLLGIPLYLGLGGTTPLSYGLVVGVLFMVGIPLCSACERRLRVQDHSGIVWDEVVGLLITLWGVAPTWQNIALGFVLFRLFDVVKPWPIGLLDRRLHGGVGIMLDDAVAGVFAWSVLQVLPALPV